MIPLAGEGWGHEMAALCCRARLWHGAEQPRSAAGCRFRGWRWAGAEDMEESCWPMGSHVDMNGIELTNILIWCMSEKEELAPNLWWLKWEDVDEPVDFLWGTLLSGLVFVGFSCQLSIYPPQTQPFGMFVKSLRLIVLGWTPRFCLVKSPFRSCFNPPFFLTGNYCVKYRNSPNSCGIT